ncbi:MAG: hypothetical protein FWD75_10875 [Propionibacteriaceae bacterium]|nr:hypothetical protein [Propionibacteriaceae bacterium]
MEYLSRYGVLGVQMATESAVDRAGVEKNIEKALQFISWGVEASADYGNPVKLVVLPEVAIHGAPFHDNQEFIDAGVCVQIPGPETDRFVELAKKYDIHICVGSWFEVDPKYPAQVFNTACIVNSEGVILKYRKVNPWIPGEGATSPLQLKEYDEELFPVVDTPLGKLGVLICYDVTFPENCRQIAVNGAEVLIRCSAYMHPFTASGPMDWWTAVSRVRSIENLCYGIHVNQGATMNEIPPYSFGGTLACDYEGRVLAQVTEAGDRLLYTHFDMDALRAWRTNSKAHLNLGHLRTEAYTYLDKPIFPGQTLGPDDPITTEDYRQLSIQSRENLWGEPTP